MNIFAVIRVICSIGLVLGLVSTVAGILGICMGEENSARNIVRGVIAMCVFGGLPSLLSGVPELKDVLGITTATENPLSFVAPSLVNIAIFAFMAVIGSFGVALLIPLLKRHLELRKRAKAGEVILMTCAIWVSLNRANSHRYPMPADIDHMDGFLKAVEKTHYVCFTNRETFKLRSLVKRRQRRIQRDAKAKARQQQIDEKRLQNFKARQEALSSVQQMLSTIKADVDEQDAKNIAEAAKSAKLIQTLVRGGKSLPST